MSEKVISVVLATRDRGQLLRRLLECLVMQTDPPPFEVIVSDNGSRDATSEVLKSFRQTLPLVSIYVPAPGKGRALNEAIAVSRGELVVFTDDDVIPDHNWLREWVAALHRYPTADVFGGRILTDAERVPRWIRESFNLSRLLAGEHDIGERERLYPFGQYPFGPNMAVRRERLLRVERPYPEDIGPGTTMPVGDETEFFLRLGCGPAEPRVYAAGAVVQHEIESENVRFNTAVRRCFLAGVAAGRTPLPASTELGENPSAKATRVVIWERVRRCRSPRELTCLVSRYLGYLRGKANRAADVESLG